MSALRASSSAAPAEEREDVLKSPWELLREKDTFRSDIDKIESRFEEALKAADREKCDYFLSLKEVSPQGRGCRPHPETEQEHLKEFLAKLLLYAPTSWYKPVCGVDCPADLKNDFEHIGVAFDASSRLRRAGIEYYHDALTEVQGTGGRCFYCQLQRDGQGPHTRPEEKEIGELPEMKPGFVRVVAVSDTHMLHRRLKVPKGHILVHAGDLSYEESRSHDAKIFEEKMEELGEPRSPEKMEAFMKWFQTESNLGAADGLKWLKDLGFKETLLVGGNHDYILAELGNEAAQKLCEAYSITLLYEEREPCLRHGLSFWGSNVSFFQADLSNTRAVKSGNNAFQHPDGAEGRQFVEALRQKLRGFRSNKVDVLVTHTGPEGCLHGKKGSEGCKALGEFVEEVKPWLYICGHSHQPGPHMFGDSWKWIGKRPDDEVSEGLGVNAACCGVWNHLSGHPFVVDVPLPSGTVDNMAESVLRYVEADSSRKQAYEQLCNAIRYFDEGKKMMDIFKTVVGLLQTEDQWDLQVVYEDSLQKSDGPMDRLKFRNFVDACLKRLEIWTLSCRFCRSAQEVCRALLPKALLFKEGWIKATTLELDLFGRYCKECVLDSAQAVAQKVVTDALRSPLLPPQEEIPVEERIEWNPSAGRSGRWEYKRGEQLRFYLATPLITDPGLWRSADGEPARHITVKSLDTKMFSTDSIRELRECFGADMTVQTIVEQVRVACAGLFQDASKERKELVHHAGTIVETLAGIFISLNLLEPDKEENRRMEDSLLAIVDLGKEEKDIVTLLRNKLCAYGPGIGKKVMQRITQCNHKVLVLSDLHESRTTYLPRLLHRLCLRSWQSKNKEPEVIDLCLGSSGSSSSGPVSCRFVTVSDTLGWDPDLVVPDGDVLLHCGNLLLQASPLGRFGEPTHVKDVLAIFNTEKYKKFQYIILIGGSHDTALFELWKRSPQELLGILPPRVVFLQKKAVCHGNEKSFFQPQSATGPGNLHPSGIDPRLDAMYCGRIWLEVASVTEEDKPIITLRRFCGKAGPEPQEHTGVIIEGTGVEYGAVGSTSEEPELAELLEEFRAEPRHAPDIIMVRCPRPKEGVRDGGPDLKSVLEGFEKKPLAIVLGQLQGAHRYEKFFDSTAVVHASLDTPLRIPERVPFVLKVPVRPCQDSILPNPWACSVWHAIDIVKDSCASLLPKGNTRAVGEASCIAMPSWWPKLEELYGREMNWSLCPPRCKEVPAKDLVAGWIPKAFIAGPVHDVHERKWKRAIRNRKVAAAGQSQSPKLFGEQPLERMEAIHKLEEIRQKWDVPDKIWEEHVTIVWGTRPEEKSSLKEFLQGTVGSVGSVDSVDLVRVDAYFPLSGPGGTKLSEFDVCGPPVQYGQQSLLPWVIAFPLPLAAYFWSSAETKTSAFVTYDNKLWLIFLFMFWHLWVVQMQCLRYIVLAQVHIMGSGFTILGSHPSFSVWKGFIFGFSLLNLMDITAQCLFFGQFLRSVHRNPEIYKVWSHTICQSTLLSQISPCRDIAWFFSFGWSLMFLQLVWMLLHVFAAHEYGVQYGMGEGETFGSMPQGYTTLASYVMPLADLMEADEEKVEVKLSLKQKWKRLRMEAGPNWEVIKQDPGLLKQWAHQWWEWFWKYMSLSESSGRKPFQFWHADILRVLATYGRMAALSWSEQSLVKMRLKQELQKQKVNVARFFQILYNRTKDFFTRLVLIDILEKGLKLEIQVSVFAIDLALQPDQTSKIFIANKQMMLALFLSFISATYAFYSHVQTFHSLWSMKSQCVKEFMGNGNWLNEASTTRNKATVDRCLCVYIGGLVVLGFCVLHCAAKFVNAFWCPYSMWNLNWRLDGCVTFQQQGSISNRTLILNANTTCPAF